MDIFTIAIWVITAGLLVFSFVKDKAKTKDALKKALFMGRGMALSIFAVIFAIGLILAVLPPEQIADIIAKQNVFVATIAAAAFGTVTLIPAFIAFPLIGTLATAGVGIMPSVAFLTTLTMVGVATFPLEKREFGIKFAVTRNALSFIFAIIIAVIMGAIL
ncbi:putative permease [Hydrogenoanaerobacterium saccharovorans]|uniref:Predicted permease n=2 Tax=Hydrogenoanaerobacterium saccharovorans TaxID=474960 RepID=A0A1H8A372_9FIRM|nr:permease [Hydrogenoanaerobacterium saccharovorans]RPF48241.1 putative permease [Hydrogenoanaerobacterium saccharovorans]SEM64229.1 Predicted permease [Hydrogenoanaerobacterium saccharovorans]